MQDAYALRKAIWGRGFEYLAYWISDCTSTTDKEVLFVSQVLITALASVSLGTVLSTDSMYNLSHKNTRTSTPEMELCVCGLWRIYEILIFMQWSVSFAGNSRPAAQDISPLLQNPSSLPFL